jgi:hypothetical protein
MTPSSVGPTVASTGSTETTERSPSRRNHLKKKKSPKSLTKASQLSNEPDQSLSCSSPCSHFSSLRDSLAGAFKCYATQIAVIHYPTALL